MMQAYVSWDGHERQEEFIAAQKQAQAEGVGLWGACRGRIPFNKY
jgi:endonuclease YncB( thermonuclease family)